MRVSPRSWLVGLVAVSVSGAAAAQSSPADYRDEFLEHFARSSRKVMSLADVVPQELYSWSPGEGVMPIVQVYMHIARYNFMYLEDNLGIPAPHGVDLDSMEDITDRVRVAELLRQSVEHVRTQASHMSDEHLTKMTTLYGRRVPGWAVLFQLISHMNEHVGQSVSYARMNGIVPPWSM
jgi:uncharacterized damage-inducible protein DinB